jgi:prepilin-type processing-associated H-X9-DG protein
MEWKSSRVVNGVRVDICENSGSEDSFGTFLWPYRGGNEPYIVGTNLLRISGAITIRPKYGVQSWHSYFKNGYPFENPGKMYSKLKDNLRMRWDSSDCKAVGASGPSGVVVLYCMKGEFAAGGYSSVYGIYNYQSHKKGMDGGNDAVFADGHVEWIKGSEIGWP